MIPRWAFAAVVVFAAMMEAGCASVGGPSSRRLEDPATLSELQRQAAAIVGDASDERERAIRLFEFVRDEIEFGFTPRFDAADPLYTLEVRRGHCNPQTMLFVALARAAGLEARYHFVTISDAILDGVWPARAPRRGVLDHSFAEVRIDGEWRRLDGYVLDRALFSGARRLLARTGSDVGFGAHREGCRDWDGTHDCMVQFASPELLRPRGDHGVFEDPTRYYRSDAYTQKMRPLTRVLYRWLGMGAMNRRLEAIREAGGG